MLLLDSLTADFTQLQPCLMLLKGTITLIISPERKAKKLQMDKNNAPKPHYFNKIIAIIQGKRWDSFNIY